MLPIHLRDATEDDIPAILSAIHRAFAEYGGVLAPPSGAHRESPETIRDKLRSGGALAALIDGEVVGCVLYQPEASYLYLGRLAVVPEHRQRGIARTLVAAVEDRARALRLPVVRLGVRTALPRNRAFFERLGYRVVGHGSHAGYAEPTFMMLEKSVLSEAADA